MLDPAIAHRLDAAAGQIEMHARISDENLLMTAIELAQTKRFLRNRRSATVPTWAVWSNQLSLGESRIRELARIGGAPDPAAALKRVRDLNAARQKRHRARQQDAKRRRLAGESMGERAPAAVLSSATPVTPTPPRHPQIELLIAWAEAAPLHDVRKALAFIDTLGSRNAGKRALKQRREAQRFEAPEQRARAAPALPTPTLPTYVSWTPPPDVSTPDTPQNPPLQNLALRDAPVAQRSTPSNGAEPRAEQSEARTQTQRPPLHPRPRDGDTPVVGGMLYGARVISVRAPAPPGTVWPAGLSCNMDGPVHRPPKRHWTPRR